jgi:hypothetical protein
MGRRHKWIAKEVRRRLPELWRHFGPPPEEDRWDRAGLCRWLVRVAEGRTPKMSRLSTSALSLLAHAAEMTKYDAAEILKEMLAMEILES